MALALNIGLAICCGGLLVWNLRLSRQARVRQIAIEQMAHMLVSAAIEADSYFVDQFGEVVDPPPTVAVH